MLKDLQVSFGGSRKSQFYIIMGEYLDKSSKSQYLSIALFNEYDIKDKITGKFITENICFNDFVEGQSDSEIKPEKAWEILNIFAICNPYLILFIFIFINRKFLSIKNYYH